ncbi:hypothetical protein EML15_08270 [Corynebacterium sp. sy017]|uniref:hypothetical protein n=1 Tax=unclassified Corynebacterium TaxID=2624378 RepID=UPI001186E6A1|nr:MULTISPECIES: hypothetical protein [unclassified Corynebacterium]MBP3089137.1 hypothetical protein [Corynebacterium sp. sy017]TSD91450.1 hypothetical protein ELY17_08280 [Corynebacterium sp. SY003]
MSQSTTGEKRLFSVHSNASSGTILIRCALFLALLLGAILGYWASTTMEQEGLPGVNAVVSVRSLAKTQKQPEQVLEDLSQIARQHRASLMVQFPDPQGRIVYGAGGKLDVWHKNGYRGLPGTPSTVVKELTDIPHEEYRQMFELSGSKKFHEAVFAYLDNQGISHQQYPLTEWTFLLTGTALGELTALLLVFCIAFCLIGVILNAHADSVRALHGFGLWRSAQYELHRAFSKSVLIIAVCVVACAGVFAALSNSQSAIQLAHYQAIFVGIALCACVLSVWLGLCALRCASIVSLLSGKLPSKAVLGSVFLIRIGACMCVASLSIGIFNYSSEWWKQHKEVPVWASESTVYSASVTGARELTEMREAWELLSRQLREMSAQGSVLYAKYLDHAVVPNSQLNRDLLFYNESAARRSVDGALEKAYRKSPYDSETRVFIPDSIPQNLDITSELERYGVSVSQARISTYASGSSHGKSWEVGDNEWINRALIADPIVVVYPNNLEQIGDRNLVAALTQKDVLFTQYSHFQELAEDPLIGNFIRSAELMSQQWAQHHQTLGKVVWIYAGALIAALFLSVVTALAVWYSCLKVFHQRLRATYIHGVIPTVLFSVLLAIEAGIVVLVAGFLWSRAAHFRAWSEGGALAGAADPSLMAAFHVSNFSWLCSLIIAVVTALPITALWLRHVSTAELIHTRR